jgi:hypothetical protein
MYEDLIEQIELFKKERTPVWQNEFDLNTSYNLALNDVLNIIKQWECKFQVGDIVYYVSFSQYKNVYSWEISKMIVVGVHLILHTGIRYEMTEAYNALDGEDLFSDLESAKLALKARCCDSIDEIEVKDLTYGGGN